MLLDTSVLVELLAKPSDDPLVRRLMAHAEGHVLFASPIHLGELADAARRSGIPIVKAVDAARKIVELVPLDAGIAVQASELKSEARRRPAGRAFSLIDGVGLASARSRGMPLLTLDAEFDGFPDAIVVAR
jgi:predicted nucleic acid-binding protein